MNIELPISNAALARELNISVQAIYKWDCVPAERAIDVSRVLDWRVTPHQIRPDIYPHPDVGLPEELRRCTP